MMVLEDAAAPHHQYVAMHQCTSDVPDIGKLHGIHTMHATGQRGIDAGNHRLAAQFADATDQQVQQHLVAHVGCPIETHDQGPEYWLGVRHHAVLTGAVKRGAGASQP